VFAAGPVTYVTALPHPPLAEGKLKGSEKFAARATVTVGGIRLSHEVSGEIELE
jgi:hypothetical protein